MKNITLLQGIRKLLGKLKGASASADMSDEEYHKEAVGISSSVVKEYLDDPELAVKRRVLGTVGPKEWAASTVTSMRIGKAVHCLGLEGETEFQHRFRVWTGRRAGNDWKEFEESVPEHLQENILSGTEFGTAVKCGESVSKAIVQMEKSVVNQGLQIIRKFVETSFFAEYSRVKVKVRPDLMYIVKNPKTNEAMFFIVDLKTTSRSVSVKKELERDMENFRYPLSATMYTQTVMDCLSSTRVLDDLGLDKDLKFVYGSFGLLWVSNQDARCSFDADIYTAGANITHPQGGWGFLGETYYLNGLASYISCLREVKKTLIEKKDIKTVNEMDYPYLTIKTTPTPWALKNVNYADVENVLEEHGGQDATEQAIRTLMKLKFNPTLIFGDKKEKAVPHKTEAEEKKEYVATGKEALAESAGTVKEIDYDLINTPAMSLGYIKSVGKKELTAHPWVKAQFPENDWKGVNIRTVRKELRKRFNEINKGDSK